MKKNELLNYVKEYIEPKLLEYKFQFLGIDKKENLIEFSLEIENRFTYIYSVSVNFNCIMSSAIKLSIGELDEYLKSINIKSEYYSEYPLCGSNLGYFILDANSSGYFYLGRDLNIIEFDDSDNGSIDSAINTMFNTEFIFGALKFIENTNSIEKIDALYNSYPLKTPNGDERHSTYCLGFGQQVFTGLLVAKFNKRNSFNELVNLYTNFVKSELNQDAKIVQDFYKLVSSLSTI